MPVKSENKARYPSNWSAEIRPAILTRAGHCCEQCGVQNYAVGYRDNKGRFVKADYHYNPENYRQALELKQQLSGCVWSELKEPVAGVYRFNFIIIVLTIAHLDHTPENCNDDNLRAWCQRCHLLYDQEHHKLSAARTRREKLSQIDMLDCPVMELQE